MTTLDQAIAQMRAEGMPDFPSGHPRVNTERIVRYGPKGKAWYRLWEFTSHNGRTFISGAFGVWGGGGPIGEPGGVKIQANYEGMDAMERARIEQAQRDQEQTERRKRVDRAKHAALRARAQWEGARKAKPEGVATYLDRKGVEHAKGLRYFPDGTVIVPMIRYDITEEKEAEPDYMGPRRLCGLQKIAPDGTKLYNKGMFKEGAACRLGPAPKGGSMMLITEGLATGLSLVMATGGKYPVYVVFDAGNILPAVKILRGIYKVSPMLICADDDAYVAAAFNKRLRENWRIKSLVSPPLTSAHMVGEVKTGDKWVEAPLVISADWAEDDNKVRGVIGAVVHGERTYTLVSENAGRKHAHRAAAEVGNAEVVFPVFANRPLPTDPDCDRLTDFNDLHKAEGLDVVRTMLDADIRRVELAAEVQKVIRVEFGKTKKSRKAAKEGGGDGAGGGEAPKRFDWDAFFQRFTLIYPTDTLWDAELAELVKLNNVKIMFGKQPVEWWLDSDRRRTVNLSDLVFEPGKVVPSNQINLFRGMPMEPASGNCERLLELLQYLCGEADQDQAPVTEWVLKWLAYPLQHPGAKMRTAVVMHGAAEGTGKNLFFGALQQIYGEYASLITQQELEDKFNGWMSRLLFLIANEVISKQEMRHHVGRLKNMVTEPVLPIRDMWAPIRYESNHVNMVFLTNEIKAMQISPTDRRYMVIYTPGVLPEAYYLKVVEEMKGGGVAALYHYLLNLDLAGFTEHTKPIMTSAKQNLIEMGLDSTQDFWTQLHDGLLWPLHYQSCLTVDAYRAYTIFCARAGHRNPRPMNMWVHEFITMNGVSRKVQDIDDPDSTVGELVTSGRRRQASVFIMGEIPPDVQCSDSLLRAHVKKSVVEFRELLREYQRNDGLRRSRDGDGDGDGWEGRHGYGAGD